MSKVYIEYYPNEFLITVSPGDYIKFILFLWFNILLPSSKKANDKAIF